MYIRQSVFDKYLTPAEEVQLLRHIAKHDGLLAKRDLAWIKFGLYTGARAETIAGFTAGDAREALNTGRIRFRAALLKGRKGDIKEKDGEVIEVPQGKDHFITLTKRRSQSIKTLLSIRKQMGQIEFPNEPLILSQTGKGLSIRSLQSRIKQWAIGAGLDNAEKVSPHWLRHTLAKRIFAASEAQDPRASVMLELGHSSIDATLPYTWPDKESHNAIIAEVG